MDTRRTSTRPLLSTRAKSHSIMTCVGEGITFWFPWFSGLEWISSKLFNIFFSIQKAVSCWKSIYLEYHFGTFSSAVGDHLQLSQASGLQSRPSRRHEEKATNFDLRRWHGAGSGWDEWPCIWMKQIVHFKAPGTPWPHAYTGSQPQQWCGAE